eukprot:CAMPEP_0197610080 /NCGR_PEP_ID=MMETSP1326-20131121/52565_1 /TAXON_ID=1155430 /ORGANISM="Genus nov. species nov., Strain RCC2288" /LENGTH=73 /DNA_ID=CAMNT_0043178545 /DNA_START=181 /DNA_END=399 /DNA_ORIENTATION=-
MSWDPPKQQPKSDAAKGQGGAMFTSRPRMLRCYLCGREYGSTSLPIHVPQCQQKWMQCEQAKPKGERRPMPQP